MSGKAVGWAFEQRGLTSGQKLVLLGLADHADDEGMCWPGRRKLAEKCDLTERSVTRAIGDLEDLELLVREPQFHEKGVQLGVVYRLNMGATLASPCPDAGVPGRATPTSPKPSIEPSLVKRKEEKKGSETVQKVWDYYVSLSNARRKEMDQTQRRVIEQALKVASPKECCQAIRALFASDFHQKRGEYAGRSGQKYRSIADALKGRPLRGESTRERIEKWVELDGEPDDGQGDEGWF